MVRGHGGRRSTRLICSAAPSLTVADSLGLYDIVSLVDVIEHTVEPMQMLREAASLLSPRRMLLIVTPDIGSATARMMRRWWWHHRVAHVGYFDRASMRRAVHEAGWCWRVTNRRRGGFPASYLAERLVRYVPIVPVSTILR